MNEELDQADLAGRLDRLEAFEEIRDLPARYAVAYGSLDMEALTTAYVDDIRSGDATGRAALQARMETGNQGPRGVRLAILHVGTHLIDLRDDGTATGSVYCRAEVERADGAWFQQAIHYGDQYVRHDGRWLFTRQRRHELFYGVVTGDRPNRLPPAEWPANDVGRGTLPDRWSTWAAFHEPSR
ncbi:MAG: nuclear transport factor 2 family protein [Aquihabitans sp.]